MKKGIKARIFTWLTICCSLILVTLLLFFAAYKQLLGPEAKKVAQETAGRLLLKPPANKGNERFDIDKLLISVKPGERTGLSALPDKILVGKDTEFSLAREGGQEHSGTGFRRYENGLYHLSVIAAPEYAAIVRVRASKPTAEPLEVYPDLWMCKTTRAQIAERFGDTFEMRFSPYFNNGFPADQRAWVVCEYSQTNDVLISFKMQYIGD